MNKFTDYTMNEYADLPDNLEYKTLDCERRKRYAMLDKKRRLKRNIVLWSLAIAIAVLYAVVIYAVILSILLGLGG